MKQKQWLFAALTAGVLSLGTTLGASLAMAQDNQAGPPPSSQSGAKAGDEGMRGHHGPPSPAEQTERLTRKLKLTSDQQSKVQSILEAARSKMEGQRSDSSLSQEDRHSKMMAIRKDTDEQIRAVLDAGQQKKFEELMARREHWGGGRPDGPPPQQ